MHWKGRQLAEAHEEDDNNRKHQVLKREKRERERERELQNEKKKKKKKKKKKNNNTNKDKLHMAQKHCITLRA